MQIKDSSNFARFYVTATQEEAAVAYDIAAIEHRGLNAVTNFDISHYVNHWHRHRHRHRRGAGGGGDSLAGTDAAAPVVVPFHLAGDLLDERTAATGLDGTLGAADLHDSEYQMPHHACPFLGDGAQQLAADQVGPPGHHHDAAAPTPSALDLLLQSPKFKEMMEQVSAAAAMADGDSGSSPAASASSLSSSPSPPQPLSPQRQPDISGGGGGGGTPARCSIPFPDDVQTFFDFENETDLGFTYAELDTFLFGDLGDYAAPMFQYCELDV